MAIIVGTSAPNKLLAGIKTAIEGGTVSTWLCDNDGDFTHSAEEWKYKAWLRPRMTTDGIVFNVLSPTKTRMSRATYAFYHSGFIEMLLHHFDTEFSFARATALAEKGDLVGP